MLVQVPGIEMNNLTGLGSSDMKSGLAASVFAAKEFKSTKGLTLIFDCDEEYKFMGITELVKTFRFKPDLVICPEPTNLEIVNGCRGILECQFTIIGRTAHAGKPQNGVNAIQQSVKIIDKLKPLLSQDDLAELGNSTINLSSLIGGKKYKNRIVTQANAVPDIAKVLLDIRTANQKLNNATIPKYINDIAQNLNVTVDSFKVNIDYQPYLTDSKKLLKFEQALQLSKQGIAYRQDLGAGGFYESAIVASSWNCPAINFGPSNGNTGHQDNEYVEIDSIYQTEKVFKTAIDIYCG